MSVVAAWWMPPVCHLPVANATGVMERINEVAPSLGASNGVRVAHELLALLEHWKDKINKLHAGSLPKGNGVEL